jgi:alpha-galactosidase
MTVNPPTGRPIAAKKAISHMRTICRGLTVGFILTLTPLLQSQPRSHILAATPPMGWNSWNWYGDKVSDKDIRQAADLLVSSGMRDAGYTYVNIDDGWQGTRDSAGVLHPNEKFPDMKALADYVHSKGLKIGIYSSPGPKTCARFEGSMGHEQQDADLYASWGIDYLKYDLCSFHNGVMRVAKPGDSAEAMTAQYKMMRDAYEKMHLALLNASRPIVYSLCQYGFDSVWQWGPEVGANIWRTTGDIAPTFDRITLIGREQAGLSRYSGPGHWNDPDMLEVGNGKLTLDENRTHMGMWAMLAAPLLAGNNLSLLTPEILAILTNREIIAIDQDFLGRQADRIFAEGPIEIWSRPLADGSRALAIFNFGEQRSYLRGISLHLREAGAADGWHARDVWAGKDLGTITDASSFTIGRHASIVLRLTK